MERSVKVLEELQKYCSLRSIGLVMNIDDNDEWTKFVTAISDIIDSYRTLEKHIAFYEKHGSYKARIIELQEENERLYEREKYLEQRRTDIINKFQNEITDTTIPKSKVKEKIEEYTNSILENLDEDRRWCDIELVDNFERLKKDLLEDK